jgi:AcrR family transcriptional regulator
MGRPKQFNREDVLSKAMPIFWLKGFSETGLQELERATGVNKSGLYSEFHNKEDLFVESLRYYYAQSKGSELLDRQPLGFQNIEDYLRAVSARPLGSPIGCFGINSLRELPQLPLEARRLIEQTRASLHAAFLKNIIAEHTSLPAEQVADMIATFFSGICIEQNINCCPELLSNRIDGLMHALKRI